MMMVAMAGKENASMYLTGAVNRCSAQFSPCEEPNAKVSAALNWSGGKVSNVELSGREEKL